MTLDEWIEAARYQQIGGHRIAYWTVGEGRPLLLVHGYPTSSWDWHRIWSKLAEDRRLVACDMIGFGLWVVADIIEADSLGSGHYLAEVVV
jgi:hypothetical protein